MHAIDEKSENDYDSNTHYEQTNFNSMRGHRHGKKEKSSKTAFKDYELAVNPLFSQFYVPDKKDNSQSKKDQNGGFFTNYLMPTSLDGMSSRASEKAIKKENRRRQSEQFRSLTDVDV